MTTLRLSLLAASAAAAAMCGVALADGGPSPGVVQGFDGIAAPGKAVRYVALPAGQRTLVAVVRTRGGRVVRFRSLSGGWGVPVVALDGTTAGISRDGRTLVLGSVDFNVRPSRFAVVSTPRLRLVRTIALDGAYSFDALSPDARTLYLVEYLSTGTPPRYRVRAYDVAAGRLLPRPVSDPRARSSEPMRGFPVSRATSRDGRWAYTLYAGGKEGPFVHALDTVRRAAVCIGLRRGGTRLVLRGESLLVERRRGRVAVIDTRTLRVRP
jgi:hypothetical protein